MAKKQKELIIFFYSPCRKKHCRIIIHGKDNNEMEVHVRWHNTTTSDEVKVWHIAAKSYVDQLRN